MGRAGEAFSSERVFLWLALVLGAAVFSLYIFAAVVVFHFGPQTRDPGWTPLRTHDNWYVGTVDERGPANGKLEPNDRILAINGDTRFSRVDPALKFQFPGASGHYSIQIMRGDSEREVWLDLPVRSDSAHVASVISLFVAGLAFYGLGLAMGVLKPGYSVTRLGCVTSFVIAVHFTGLILRSVAPMLTGGDRVVYELTNSVVPWHLALGYAFFSRFPSVVPESRVWKVTSIFIYLYCTVLFLPRAILNFVAARGEEFAINYQLAHSGWIGFYQEHFFVLENAFRIIAAAAMCLVLRRNYKLLAEVPDQRRRVKWVVLAAAIGNALPALFSLPLVARGNVSVPRSGPYPLDIMVTNLFSVVIPVTLGYAVIKHRVLGINVVVRRGIQYLLAKNTLRLLLLVPVLAIAWSVAAHPDRTVAEIVLESSLFSYGFLVVSAAISLKYRRQLSRWVDRKFFREAHDQELILLDLIERLRLAESVNEILTLIGTRVKAALHPSSLYVCCRQIDAAGSIPNYSCFGGSPEIAVADHEELMRIAGKSQGPMEVVPGRAGLPNRLAKLIEQLGTRLIVPVRDSHQRPIGFVLLGEKKSEEPYTTSNQSLLKAIAAEMGISLDLIWLRERLENEQKMKDNALALVDRQTLNLVKECAQCGACFDTADEKCSWDNSPLDSPLLVERVIDGKYRLDRLIGKGAYGAVYEAWDLSLKRKVAIKVVTSSLLRHNSALRRFEREAQAAARLNHRNIVVIYDYGMARPGGAYMAMELVRGSTWRSELRRMRVIAPPLAAEWLDQLLEGVGAAHQEGVIHRDLKPENVVIAAAESGPGQIKILDFGMAKMRLLDPTDPDSLTLAGAVVGTLGYMSPEQFTGAEIDERSDIFSLGVMTVEALSGRRPFQGRTPAELLKSLLNDSVQLKADGREGKEINRVMRRCLAKKVSDRYRSVSEMRQELIPAVRNCPAVALEERPEEQVRTMTMGS